MKDIKISQSLLKSLFNYKKGAECGILIYEHYLNGLESEPTKAMQLGNWFEYQCTDQLPRNGKIPEADRIKSGDLTAPYRSITVQVDNYKRILSRYGIKILETGYVFNHPKGSGIADIIAEWNGEKVIIDIKTTGQIDDKWSLYGWAEEKFENSDSDSAQHLTIQAVQYKVLARHEWAIPNIPFYFFVFSTTNEVSCKIFRVNVDDERLDKHEEQIKTAYQYMNNTFVNMDKADLSIPQYAKCIDCPLKDTCEFMIDVPLIKDIYVY